LMWHPAILASNQSFRSRLPLFRTQRATSRRSEKYGGIFDEEHEWLRRAHRSWRPYSYGSTFLRHECSGSLHNNLRYGFDAVLDQNVEIVRDFKPLGEKQMTELREHGRQFNDGRYELFKSTVKYDGDVGREQHNFPPAAELPA
jgi:hypothetical protein